MSPRHDPEGPPGLPPRLGPGRNVQAAITRLARRLARSGGWRHMLVVGLIGLSVAAAAGVAVVARSSTLPEDVAVAAELGTADLRVDRMASGVTFDQLPAELKSYVREVGAPIHDVRPTDVTTTLRSVVPDADVLTVEQSHAVGAETSVRFLSLDVSDPLAAGLLRVDGPPPQSGQALLAPSLLRRLDAEVGQSASLPGIDEPVEVVGTAVDPRSLEQPLAVLPAGTTLPGLDRGTSWLVDVPDGTSVESVASRLREADAPTASGGPAPGGGASVTTREEVASWTRRDRTVTEQPSFIGSVAGAALLLQVAFVAAAAFATGIRRRLRNLGLLGATGASPRHIRGLVLREAAVLGTAGATAGVLLGVGFAYTAGRTAAEELANNLAPTVALHPLDLLAPAALGILAAIAAAYLPARTASRVPVTTALSGRMPVGDVPRWITPAAVATSAAGLLLLGETIRSARFGPDRTVLIGAAVVAAVLGVAALSVPLLGLAGRHADRLPARLRLPLRDTVRQRTRSASAVAALTVVFVIPVAAVTSMHSEARHWTPPEDLRRDVVSVSGPIYAGLQLPATDAMLDRARAHLPPVQSTTIVRRLAPPGVGHGGGIRIDALTGQQERVAGHGRAAVSEMLGAAALATPELLDLLGLSELQDQVADGTVLFLDLPNVHRPGGLPRSGRATIVVEPVEPAVPTTDPAGPAPDGQATAPDGARPETRQVTAPLRTVASEAATYDLPELLLPPSVADRLGLRPAGETLLYDLAEPLDPESARILAQVADTFAPPFYTAAPTVFSTTDPTGAIALVVGAALLLALIIAAMTTALAATESDHDLQLITAVGAAPTIRRSFHGLQAGYHALLAAALALPTGLLIHAAGVRDIDTAIPYGWLALTVLGIPATVGLLHLAAMRNAPVRAPRRIT